ncbi:MAG TPA: autotransporter outer membrane beta-barrel domain-containing protein, partial [Stellaceae bacterium]|nr:autotransporter outer membrane beta-barrel domain-containing protein [Stellaceae bacterium]
YDQLGTKRQIAFGPVSEAAIGSTHGNEVSLKIATGLREHVERFLIEPSADLGFDHVDHAAYTESGTLGLAVGGNSVDSLRLGLGVRAQTAIAIGDGYTLRPEARLRFEHHALDEQPVGAGAFAAEPLFPFTIAGVKPGREAGIAGAGLTLDHGPALALYADYTAELRTRETVQAVLAGVRIRW